MKHVEAGLESLLAYLQTFPEEEKIFEWREVQSQLLAALHWTHMWTVRRANEKRTDGERS